VDDQPLENLGSQSGEAQEAADVAVGEALVGGQIAERGDVAAWKRPSANTLVRMFPTVSGG
jgi:hypothetical protein